MATSWLIWRRSAITTGPRLGMDLDGTLTSSWCRQSGGKENIGTTLCTSDIASRSRLRVVAPGLSHFARQFQDFTLRSSELNAPLYPDRWHVHCAQSGLCVFSRVTLLSPMACEVRGMLGPDTGTLQMGRLPGRRGLS